MPVPLFSGKCLQHFSAPHSFSSLKFSIEILLALLILPMSQLDVKYEVIHRVGRIMHYVRMFKSDKTNFIGTNFSTICRETVAVHFLLARRVSGYITPLFSMNMLHGVARSIPGRFAVTQRPYRV